MNTNLNSLNLRRSPATFSPALGKLKKTDKPKPNAPKDGITDDTRAILENLRQKPVAVLAKKQEKQAILGSKTQQRVPRAGSDMAQMLDTMANPPGVGRMSVNENGLITMETERLQDIDTPKPTDSSAAEVPRFRDSNRLLKLTSSIYLGAALGSAGPFGLGAGLGLAATNATLLDLFTLDALGKNVEVKSSPPLKTPRPGSAMAEMLENMHSPKPETAVVVGENGYVTMKDNAFA